MLVFWENGISPTPNTYLGSGSRHRAPSRMVISRQQLQMHSVKWRPVYVKHTSPKSCTFQRASRLHQMHIRKIECRLVYGKCSFIEKWRFANTKRNLQQHLAQACFFWNIQKTNQRISKTHHLKLVFGRGWGWFVNHSFSRFTGQNYQTSDWQHHVTLTLAAVISGPKR